VEALMARRTWEDRELPIIHAIVDAAEAGQPIRDIDRLREVTGLADPAVRLAVGYLIEEDYISAIDASSLSGPDWLNLRPTTRALRLVDVWPASGFEELIRAIDQQLASEADEDRRSRLTTFKQSALNVGESMVASLLTKVVTSGVG
jgi:hypothetical protein